MYEQEDDYAEEGEDSEEISNEIWQEACWIVISAYFDEKGRYRTGAYSKMPRITVP